MTLVDLEKLTGEELRHFAYIADRRVTRSEKAHAHLCPYVAGVQSERQFRNLGNGPVWQDALAQQEAEHLAHPEQLAVIVKQIAEWTDDKELIVGASVLHAEKCGIPRETFVPIIAEAMRQVIYVS